MVGAAALWPKKSKDGTFRIGKALGSWAEEEEEALELQIIRNNKNASAPKLLMSK